jgi:ElaA protein
MDLDKLLWRQFRELTVTELYAVLRLRSEAFVVEQQCIYPDLDGKDEESRHLIASKAGTLLGYLRLQPADRTCEFAKIGRVVVDPAARGQRIGCRLIDEAIAEARRLFGPVPVKVSAQSHLEDYYRRFGFLRTSADYADYGIVHCDMVRSEQAKRL